MATLTRDIRKLGLVVGQRETLAPRWEPGPRKGQVPAFSAPQAPLWPDFERFIADL